MKKTIFLSLCLLAAAAGRAGAAETAAAPEAWKSKTFTAEELKKYNGRDGMPAYVAVDGIVYDFSRSKSWKSGQHMKMHDAGADLSAEFHKAPKLLHKDGKVLEKMPKVGMLVKDAPVTAEKPAAAVAPSSAPAASPAPAPVSAPVVAPVAAPAAAPDVAPVAVPASTPVSTPAGGGVAMHKITKEEVGKEERCAITQKKLKVTESTPALDYKGKIYYFSSTPLVEQFTKEPEKYLGSINKAKSLLKKKA